MTDKVNVLLVDDQPDKLLAYDVILNGLGENLVKAASAREALQFLLKIDVAVVLIDVCMPELDGFQLAAMLREHPRFKETAIIFISAIHLTDIDRIRGYEMGAVDYVPVPVIPEVLRAKVKIFVELHRKTRELEQLNSMLERHVAERTAELEASNAPLFALQQPRVRSFKFGGAFGDMALQHRVELFELASLAVQLDEYLDFRPQHFRNHWHRDIIHRAHLISADAVDIGQVNRRNEDDRRFLEAWMLPQHGRQLKAIELRHADVDEHNRHIVLEQELQRLACRCRLDQIFAKAVENHVVSEELVWLIVDQQDVDFVGHGRCPPSDAATSAARTGAVRC